MRQTTTESNFVTAPAPVPSSLAITTVQLCQEHDVVLARQRAREIAGRFGFDAQDQTRIATAVSELARNALMYGGGGEVEFRLEGRTVPQLFLIRIGDRGPGIANLEDILAGRYRSSTGMGLGIAGARRLVDQCQIRTELGRGTRVELKKLLPLHAPLVTPASVRAVLDFLSRQRLQNPLEELQHQNHELVRALAELRQRQEELEAINHELEDTNRGVVALYAELDEKAGHLRHADELKTRFLSDMSHEFRTPLNSILALAALLLDGADGPLNSEQEKQVGYIRKSGENLLELVNDLLDLAKIEAGKIEVRPTEFAVENLFSALRGMLRPLLVNQRIQLIFQDCAGLPLLESDEGKVSQILRNLVSNAIKFTERGEVRVSARYDEASQSVTFAVADTGLGIAPQDQERIFEDFTQIDNPAQRKFRGTGLGLPLCRKLAGLLGGRIALESQLGVGSTFSLTLPRLRQLRRDEAAPAGAELMTSCACDGMAVLVVEDDPQTRLLYEKYLRRTVYRAVAAGSLRQARAALRQQQPAAIILDILLRGEDSWNFLAELKANDATRRLPIIVASTVDDRHKALALGADAYFNKPVERAELLAALAAMAPAPPAALAGDEALAAAAPNLPERRPPAQAPAASATRVLIIEHEPVFRYIVRRYLEHHPCIVHEAGDGAAGLTTARQSQAELIFLVLGLPDIAGSDLLRRLKAEPATRATPVVIVTAGEVTSQERTQLRDAVAVINKRDLNVEQAGQLLRYARRHSAADSAVCEGLSIRSSAASDEPAET